MHPPTDSPAEAVTDVHVVFKTHLDLGFTGLARDVVDQYRAQFFPAAMGVARELREAGGPDRLVWTTGSWLVRDFLAHAPAPLRAEAEAAIAAGDLAWHALPFTTHTELMDPQLFRDGLAIAAALDRRFGRATIAAKMTDVPGHTRAMVPLLARAGVSFLHIGVNPASSAPDVPPLFVWRDRQSGAELVVMYHAGSYGDLMLVPGLAHAIVFAHANDNHGPPSAPQVRATLGGLRERFPAARVYASTMDAFAARLGAARARLPVVEQELGDTWVHGAGSDPRKLAGLRAMLRARSGWLADGRLAADDPRYDALSDGLLKVCEHTWGLDVKTFLADTRHYDAASVGRMRAEPAWRLMERSWAEQRAYLDEAAAALADTPLAAEAAKAVAAGAPRPADRSGFTPCDPSARWEVAHFSLGIDPRSGAITTLAQRDTGRAWADADHPLALVRYELFAQADYDRFYEAYIAQKELTAAWSVLDFTKPGMAATGPAERSLSPMRLVGAAQRADARGLALLLDLRPDDELAGRYGCPARLTLAITLPADRPEVQIELCWFDKAPMRLPEALWCSFVPITMAGGSWRYHKLGAWVDPADVAPRGGRTLHAVDAGVRYEDGAAALLLETIDAPLVAPGAPSLLRFGGAQPDPNGGAHVNLLNNVWGTNFTMWYGDDARFRFVLRPAPARSAA